MAEAIISRRGSTSKNGGWPTLQTNIITANQNWTVPNNISSDISVRIFGGGSGAVNSSTVTPAAFYGGSGGIMNNGSFTIRAGTVIPITIGAGGRASITYQDRTNSACNGGITSFGTYLSALGGCTNYYSGCNYAGGSGGGHTSAQAILSGSGNGETSGSLQFGGGGIYQGSSYFNAGIWGGGGGGAGYVYYGTHANYYNNGKLISNTYINGEYNGYIAGAIPRPTGGLYGGNGGSSNRNDYNIISSVLNGNNGTNTIGNNMIPQEFRGYGRGGKGYQIRHGISLGGISHTTWEWANADNTTTGGGGGGFGGNGGNAASSISGVTFETRANWMNGWASNDTGYWINKTTILAPGSGGGGGYGANGGNGNYYGGCGGGGGYLGNGGNAQGSNGGGGGGYGEGGGSNNPGYAGGGCWGRNGGRGGDGICIIQYYTMS